MKLDLITLACVILLTSATAVDAADPAPASASSPSVVTDNSQAIAAFEALLQAAVQKKAYYPNRAIRTGAQGVVTVEFDYAGDGKATNVTSDVTAGDRNLIRAAIYTVQNATLPPKPPELAGVSHFHIKLTYTLGN